MKTKDAPLKTSSEFAKHQLGLFWNQSDGSDYQQSQWSGSRKCLEKHKGIKRNPINGWRTRTIAAIMYKFLEIHKLQKLTQKKLHIMHNIPM